jgi:hypothetical protein
MDNLNEPNLTEIKPACKNLGHIYHTECHRMVYIQKAISAIQKRGGMQEGETWDS